MQLHAHVHVHVHVFFTDIFSAGGIFSGVVPTGTGSGVCDTGGVSPLEGGPLIGDGSF